MKKELLKAKVLLVALMMVATTAMFVACDDADDVDDDPSGQLPGGDEPGGDEPGGDEPGEEPGDAVKLDAPEFTAENLERGAGEEVATLTITWGKVDNAVKYHVEVTKTAQVTAEGMTELEENVLSKDTGDLETAQRKVTVDVEYGAQYTIAVNAVGDGENYADSDAAEVEYFWYVAPTTVEAGDLAEILPALLAEVEGDEATFALVAGREYTMSAPVDFGKYRVIVKSMANVGTEEEPVIVENGAHAVVALGVDGVFRTGNSLTLKNLSIDAGAQVLADGTVTKPSYLSERNDAPGWGIVECSEDEAALAAASQVEVGRNNYLLNSITIDGCYIKDVPCNVTHTGKYAWAFGDITVTNSIIQLNNNGHYANATVFGTYGGAIQPDGGTNWRIGAIRDLKVENSTIYNIQLNDQNRMIRWNGNSNTHHFADGTEVSITFNNVTLSKVMTGKEFANGTWSNKNWATITFTNNVYRDCYRVLNKMNVGNCISTITGNLGWWSGENNSGDSAAVEAGDPENDASTIETFGGAEAVDFKAFTFGGDYNKQLDFTAADGPSTIPATPPA